MLNLIKRSNKASLIELEVEKIYSANCEDIKRDLEPFLKEECKIYLSLKHVGFMDSSGIGFLISTLRKAIQKNSELYLCNCSPSVLALFELVKLKKVISILDDESEIEID